MRLARSASLLGFVVLVACGATETVATPPASSDAGASPVAPPSPPAGDAGGPAMSHDASAEDGAPGEAGVSMWRGAATLVPEAPAVHTSAGYRAGFISAVAAKNGVLAVAALAQNAVFIYRDGSALTAGAAADHVISRPELEQPTSLVFDRTGRLYVGDTDGVLVFDSVATGPAFVTELRGAGRVSALAVLE